MIQVEGRSDAFLAALAAQDFDSIADCFEPDVSFHAVVPNENPFRECTSARAAAALMRRWFGEADPLELLQAYVRVSDGGKIAQLDLVCSGFQPVAEQPER